MDKVRLSIVRGYAGKRQADVRWNRIIYTPNATSEFRA